MLKSYLSPKTKVKKSSISGMGLFAIKPIKKGEIVSIKGGHIVDLKTSLKIEKFLGDSFVEIDDNFAIGPLEKNEVGKIMMFINHSCNPNVGIRGEITCVAMRNIKKGEDLFFDYAMLACSSYELKCNCGQKNCRKIITGKDWRNKKLQKKYQGFFSRYIQDKIDKM